MSDCIPTFAAALFALAIIIYGIYHLLHKVDHKHRKGKMREKKKVSEETAKLMAEGYRANAEEDLRIAQESVSDKRLRNMTEKEGNSLQFWLFVVVTVAIALLGVVTVLYAYLTGTAPWLFEGFNPDNMPWGNMSLGFMILLVSVAWLIMIGVLAFLGEKTNNED